MQIKETPLNIVTYDSGFLVIKDKITDIRTHIDLEAIDSIEHGKDTLSFYGMKGSHINVWWVDEEAIDFILPLWKRLKFNKKGCK